MLLGQIEFGEFPHAGNKRELAGNSAKRVSVRLALHGARVGVDRGQENQRERCADQSEQLQVGEVRQTRKAEALAEAPQNDVGEIEAEKRRGDLQRQSLKNVAMYVMAELVSQHSLDFVVAEAIISSRFGSGSLLSRYKTGLSALTWIASKVSSVLTDN